jgi:hypothetical protein
VKVSIVGSCVTRDVLQVVEGLSIGPYLARTSLASIASPAQQRLTVDQIRFDDDVHPWHLKLITADFEKTHDEMLQDMVGGFVVIDLIEERVELLEPIRKHYVTRGQILAQKSNVDDLIGSPVKIFSRKGLKIWRRALPTFAAMLRAHVPNERVIVNRTLYTNTVDSAGTANRFLDKMYDDVAAAFPGCTVLRPSAAVFRSEPNHKWGPAPYHFVDEFYFEMARRIMDVCGIDLPMRPGFTFLAATPTQRL